MKSLSVTFPDVVFTLHGIGEEHGDEWNKYFLGGVYYTQYAKTTIAPFSLERIIQKMKSDNE